MAYIALDILTQECVGPFDTEEQVVAFTVEASDALGEKGLAFNIHELLEPIEWALNNNAELTDIEYEKEQINGNSKVEVDNQPVYDS
jgi:hypothetical protein